jgi:hypothetical protein
MRTDSEQVGIEAQTEIKTQTEASSPNWIFLPLSKYKRWII